MASSINDGSAVSAAFFCPQARAPTQEYLAGLRIFLGRSLYGQRLLEEVRQLDKTWSIFLDASEAVRNLPHGRDYVQMLTDWAGHGSSAPVARARSGIIALPLLVILQVGQYLRYLEFHGLSHAEFITAVKLVAGLHGYCGGLPSAIAIACSEDEEEVIQHTSTVLRVLLGVGAYSEAAEEEPSTGSTTLAIRLKYDGQGEELVRLFPGTYVSAVTDPKSISIVGPVQSLNRLYEHVKEQGLSVQKMDVRGKVHNPENKELATELCEICDRTPSLKLPNASILRVCVRSNKSGEPLLHQSLTEEIVRTILASKCEWFVLLNEVAKDFKNSGRTAHEIVVFGMNDCVPMLPFHKQRVQVSKIEAHRLMDTVEAPRAVHDTSFQSKVFLDDAIAVTGASCRLPGANNLNELWQILSTGIDCHQELPSKRFDPQESFRALRSTNATDGRKIFGNFLSDISRFDNAFFGINAREATNMDPQQRILLELSYEALEASGYLSSHDPEAGDSVGCFIGASYVEYLDNTNSHDPTAYTATGTIRAFLCGKLSHYYGWSGPSEVIDTACSSSLVAINRACKAIQNGECYMALAGGVNVITGINNYLDLSKAGFLSPTGQCKPFDKSADGYCRSDGAGLVVLKRLKQAIEDGDQVMGVVPGIATNQGGLSSSVTVPHSPSQKRLYQTVLQQTGVQPEQVTYVEAHGTGTQVGDPIEMESLRSVFGSSDRPETLYVGSIKGNLGHCETAGGVAGLLKILAMLKHGKIPPQANYAQLNPKIPPLDPDGIAIPQKLQDWLSPLRTALVNGYGAAGSNCALLCCELPKSLHERAQFSSNERREGSFPIILSAASISSLFASARLTAACLRKGESNSHFGDVAFTLNERRRKHKFCLSTIATGNKMLAEYLEACQAPAFEYPGTSNPVVLVFSGQNQAKVELDQALYEGHSLFRSYIDAIDLQLRNLGYRSIFPAIFQPDPILDAVSLQCSIFAVQYACARCWIDAGLKVHTVIGHSLGELSALAVSGVLSLEDCTKLIAFRAHLIETKWNAEKGAMLAIQAAPEDVKKLVAQLKSGHKRAGPDIACYNASTSLVISGTTEVIDAAEELLMTDVDFQKTKFQRLKTTHGFHSSLVEPILADLERVCKGLEWHSPQIPLEFCTEENTGSVRNYCVSEHARKPVFFANAIHRVEARLGSCIWFEGGMDTSIIPMTKKACQNPEIHQYQAAASKRSKEPNEMVNEVVMGMWGHGISLSHWRFLPREKRSWRQFWLPPYQFDGPSHWLPNIDRRMELQQSIVDSDKPNGHYDQSETPPKLLTRRNSVDACQGSAEFSVNTHSQRFKSIVSGHAVRQRPLCPASMYMECVTMAVQLVVGEIGESNLEFEDLDFQAPLGLDSGCEVVLTLEKLGRNASWKFVIHSFPTTVSNSRPLVHASGTVALIENPKLMAFQRLVTDAIDELNTKADMEKLVSKRAYKLFASAVEYDHFFRGISSITLDSREAIANIRLPDGQPGREDSASWRLCDTVAIDSFIQTIGLLINSSDDVSKDEVVVSVGIEQAVISVACKMHLSMSWKAYAKFAFTSGSQAIGDVFVSSAEGDLVALLSGCRFRKLPTSKLERSLDIANPRVGPGALRDSNTLSGSSGLTAVEGLTTKDYSGASTREISATEASTPIDADESALRTTISNYTGIEASEVHNDIVFADLGLDSLASVEVAAELQEKFGLDIREEQLGSMTLSNLMHLLVKKHSVGQLDQLMQSERKIITRSDDVESDAVSSAPQRDSQNRQRLFQILVDASGAVLEDIREANSLGDLGIDSLSLTDMKHQIETTFSVRLPDDFPSSESMVNDLVQHLGISNETKQTKKSKDITIETKSSVPIAVPHEGQGSSSIPNPFEALTSTNNNFDTTAREQGFSYYWSEVSSLQTKLVVAYILEAFSILGVNLLSIPQNAAVPEVPCQQKHNRLMQRFWDILENQNIVSRKSGKILRGCGTVDQRTSSQLSEAFQADFPRYKIEAKLMHLTGSKLASCLSGTTNPISLMFASRTSSKIMEEFYSKSPMLSTLTEQLVAFLETLLRQRKVEHHPTLRILEVGAGTGGTTLRVTEALETMSVPVEYTFTDISPSLVSSAKSRFGKYSWMRFASFDLEKDVSTDFRNKFDIVIGTNCVHATTNRVATCRRLRETLREGGIAILSEVTRIINWYDICFGLLDGWWLASESLYPLQPASTWMSTFKEAGFLSTNCSQGNTAEANTQRLLVGCTKDWNVLSSFVINLSKPQESAFKLETMVYKEVNGLQIHADVYLPRNVPESPARIALMIHGGGHMTLSRKWVRPYQTKHLLANGFIPISVDYRLCPEINLVDGAIKDVRDAYVWARDTLPQELLSRGIISDGHKIVVIGWSTGGHLALSIGWTAKDAGVPPPSAILSFYAPLDFESRDLENLRASIVPERRISMERIIEHLSPTPITTYETACDDSTNLGWVQPGDPRSELVMSVFREDTGLPLLLSGLSRDSVPEFGHFKPPSQDQIAAISPFAQLRLGNYAVPTCIVHGTEDEIAPFSTAQRFVAAMREKEIECKMLAVEKGEHTYDLALKPETEEWKRSILPGYRFLFRFTK